MTNRFRSAPFATILVTIAEIVIALAQQLNRTQDIEEAVVGVEDNTDQGEENKVEDQQSEEVPNLNLSYFVIHFVDETMVDE
jgi:hypothetical protein